MILVFQTAFNAAANSIISGGACEKMTFASYMLLSVVFSGWIYPLHIHWCYGNGWLMKLGYHDFAGSGVHIVGGFGALAMALILGPRKNRFDPVYAEEFRSNNIGYIAGSTLLVRS